MRGEQLQMQVMEAAPAAAWARGLAVALVLATGCAETADTAAKVARSTVTRTPDPSGTGPSPVPSTAQTGAATGSPSPSPASGGAGDVKSGVDTSYTAPPVQGYDQVTPAPSPSPTPLGALTRPIALGADPVGLAFLQNTVRPYVLRPADFVAIAANSEVGSAFGQSGGLGVAIAADGAKELWIAWSSPHRAERWQLGVGDIGQTLSVSLPAAPVAVAAEGGEAWAAMSGGTLIRIRTAPQASTSFSGFGTPTALALEADSVWVTSASNTLYRASRSTGTPVATYSTGASPVGIAVDASGSVWTADKGASAATRVSSDGQTTTISLGAPPAAVLADARRIWFAVPGKLLYYRPDGTKEGEVTLLVDEYYTMRSFDPSGLATDAYGRIWAIDRPAREAVAVWGRKPGE